MERIAKIIAKCGYCSRRKAEELIFAGKVTLNAEIVNSPAVNVLEDDVITINGKKLDRSAFIERLFIYYKPAGLLCTNHDEKGRETIFDHLPDHLPRLMSVGRLDLNTEGLLLLTTSGELARKMELPATGLVRSYSARVLGKIDPLQFKKLANGVAIDGVNYGPVDVTIEKMNPKAANNWLSVSIREGKNREVRKILASIGLTVNRLIRKTYGPYSLDGLKKGQIKEVPIVKIP